MLASCICLKLFSVIHHECVAALLKWWNFCFRPNNSQVNYPSRFSTDSQSSGNEKDPMSTQTKETLRRLYCNESIRRQMANPRPDLICYECGLDVYGNNFPYLKAHMTEHGITISEATYTYADAKLKWMRKLEYVHPFFLDCFFSLHVFIMFMMFRGCGGRGV